MKQCIERVIMFSLFDLFLISGVCSGMEWTDTETEKSSQVNKRLNLSKIAIRRMSTEEFYQDNTMTPSIGRIDTLMDRENQAYERLSCLQKGAQIAYQTLQQIDVNLDFMSDVLVKCSEDPEMRLRKGVLLNNVYQSLLQDIKTRIPSLALENTLVDFKEKFPDYKDGKVELLVDMTMNKKVRIFYPEFKNLEEYVEDLEWFPAVFDLSNSGLKDCYEIIDEITELIETSYRFFEKNDVFLNYYLEKIESQNQGNKEKFNRTLKFFQSLG